MSSTFAFEPYVLAITGFLRLPTGWHYGRGIAALPEVAWTALEVAGLLRDAGATSIEAFPDESGGILVSGYNTADCVDVFCNPGGYVSLQHTRGDADVADVSYLQLAELGDYLGGLPWRRKRSLDSSIHFISVQNSEDLRVSPSRTQREAASQSSTRNAQSLQAGTFAATSESIMNREFLGIRRSSGELSRHPSLRDAA
ncbi:hypothetical protein [Pseudoxanthobacter sp. M-2]|uniref:hypothetical protein n=1 Tax=Pseudoxanthobacter sp. M-2 TaxID=3078754 RepID=UPI0038FD03FB